MIDFFTTTPVPPEEPSEDVVDSARPLTAGEILPQTVQQEASALIVVADEEMVAIDLTDPTWKMIKLPYLVSLHASAVTCTQYISYVDEEVYNNIVTAGMNIINYNLIKIHTYSKTLFFQNCDVRNFEKFQSSLSKQSKHFFFLKKIVKILFCYNINY